MDKNAGSPMAASQIFILYSPRLMEKSSVLLLLKEDLKDLRRVRKSIKWELRDLPRFNFISRIAKFLLKICWAKPVKATSLLLTYSISAGLSFVRQPWAALNGQPA